MELLKKAALKMGIAISGHQLDMFDVYYTELANWNKKINLTTITAYDDVQIKHLLDSITLLPFLGDCEKARIIDIGSGGGFPGIPLKIMLPHIQLTLIESTGKKAQFLKHLISALELGGVEVITARAEEAASQRQLRGIFDIAVTRAVGSLSTVLELTLPFCKTGGLSITYKKSDIDDELMHAKDISAELGGEFYKSELIDSDALPDSRRLVFFRKVSPTQDKYPRRAGMPSKRPL